MKSLLPHLLYLMLIAAVGLFYGQRLTTDSQTIMLLNRTTNEAILTANYYNGELQKDIRKFAKEYPSLRHTEVTLLAYRADSLVLNSFSDAASRDSLSSRLWKLTDRDPVLSKVFQTLLPSKKQSGFSQEYQTMLLQNDSIRRYWTLEAMLNYCAEKMTRPCWSIDYFLPTISHTMICPAPGKHFETDIVLSKLITRSGFISLKVNGRTLPYNDGLAHFVQTFSMPGIYPLQVTAEGEFWEMDSLIRIEKTFYLHVNH